MTNPRDEARANLRRMAEAQRDAYAKMREIGEGVGGLGVRHPEMFEDMIAWNDLTENGFADIVLALLDEAEPTLPHIVTAPDGAAYPCSCPIVGDHPLLTATPEQYMAMISQGFRPVAEPTPDEREALARAQWDDPINVITWDELTERAARAEADYAEVRQYALDAAARGIAAGFHRQGPITDDTEWEYEVTYSPVRRTPSIDGYRLRASSGELPSLARAEEWAANVSNPMIRRRTKGVEPGSWEPVEAAEAAR